MSERDEREQELREMAFLFEDFKTFRQETLEKVEDLLRRLEIVSPITAKRAEVYWGAHLKIALDEGSYDSRFEVTMAGSVRELLEEMGVPFTKGEEYEAEVDVEQLLGREEFENEEQSE